MVRKNSLVRKQESLAEMELEQIQREVASLKKRISVLEDENHNLSTASLRNQSMDTTYQNPEIKSENVMTFYANRPIDEVLTALGTGESLDRLVANYEAAIIEKALTHCDCNKAKAARLLKVRANTLHYKLLRHQVQSNPKNSHGSNGGYADCASSIEQTIPSSE